LFQYLKTKIMSTSSENSAPVPGDLPIVPADQQLAPPDFAPVQAPTPEADNIQTPPLLSEQQVTSRFEGIRRACQVAKAVGTVVAQRHIFVEHEGYRLGLGQSMKARTLGRFMTLSNNARISDARNPVVRQAHAERFKTEPTKFDLVKAAAWELGTAAPVRLAGLTALAGAAGLAEVLTTADSKAGQRASAVKQKTDAKLERFENGNENPVTRRQNVARRVQELTSTSFFYLENEAAAWDKAKQEAKRA
jgi:hypothetical protein